MDRVVAIVAASPARAMFVTELARLAQVDVARLEPQLSELVKSGRGIVVDHYVADPHVDGDLRVVAVRTDEVPAQQMNIAAARVWNEWVREFLRTHRCV